MFPSKAKSIKKATIVFALSVWTLQAGAQGNNNQAYTQDTNNEAYTQDANNEVYSYSNKDELYVQRNKHEVYAPSFGHNWFAQLGLDMSLQNPYGHSFKETFPKGRTFGINAALGRWFTPELGLRFRLNWENGIRAFENPNAEWLPPFNQVGVNMDRGGYIVFTGDIPLNIFNLIKGYKENRLWNLSVFPRAGIAYNFGVSKGSPLIGLGLHNTIRLMPKLSVYLDAAYQFASSGFQPSDVPTGTGTGSNGFADLSIGIQYNIAHSGFTKAATALTSTTNQTLQTEETTATNQRLAANQRSATDLTGRTICKSFWNDWFIQAGLDMSLHKPYRKDFKEVFPKGRTMGFNASIGKFFSPEVAIRARLNWENGFPLFKNKKLEWVASETFGSTNNLNSTAKTNMEKGGYLTAGIDVMLSMTHILFPATKSKWNLLGFARAGLGSNLAIKSASPLVGAGAELTRRITPTLGLYADIAYQAITSEFYGNVSCTGMSVSTGHNGFFDLCIGLQIDLGKNRKK